MVSRTVIAQLQGVVGAANIASEPEDLLVLGYDATPGIHLRPDVVIYPTSTQQVVHLMELLGRATPD